jgi:hypothetical protein
MTHDSEKIIKTVREKHKFINVLAIKFAFYYTIKTFQTLFYFYLWFVWLYLIVKFLRRFIQHKKSAIRRTDFVSM